MTEEQILIAKALSQCNLWGKADTFVSEWAHKGRTSPDSEMTEAQNTWLYDLLHKYRKQLSGAHDTYCPKCNQQGRMSI